MSKHSKNSTNLVGIITLAVFVVAFASLFFAGDYKFIASFFMALLIALLTGIVLYLALVRDDQDGGISSGTGTGSKAVTATGAGGAESTAGTVAETDDEAARKAAIDAEAARKAAADEEAARKAAAKAEADEKAAAEAESARKAAAEAESARKAAAEAESARKAAAEAESARKAAADAEAEAARSAPADTVAAPGASATALAGEDYDGDGIYEGVNEGTRPAGLDAPRDGKADDLKQIKGVGPKLEKLCNSLGFWHFDQVAAWTADEVAWVDANLMGFKGRVSRDEWVEQARILASGGATEFSKRVEGGDLY